jgi:hypothetical protein
MSRLDAEQAKQHAGIEPYKSRLPGLKKDGSKYKAKCLWHDDSNPSLELYQKDGVWLFGCFPCNAKGDVFSFVQKVDGISFPKALKKIAEETGFVAETEPDFQYDAEKASDRLSEAESYLASRGISIDEARAAGLGVLDFPDPDVGKCIVIPYGSQSESGQPVVKMRSLAPKTKNHKFRHLKDAPSANLLYGLKDATATLWLNPDLWISESELDCLTLRARGYNAISVSSATTCLNKDGSFKFDVGELRKLAEDAERIFLALDQDKAGNQCAEVFQKVLPGYKTFRVNWPYEKGTDEKEQFGLKDIGDLYAAGPDSFSERLDALAVEAVNRPPVWRQAFKSLPEMEQGDLRFLIDRILPEGVTFLGALSGAGKTWFALSMARALTTGKPFLGNYRVTEPVNVIYLVPEAGERSFRRRMERMGINERFLCRTMRDGVIRLADPLLLSAVRELKPVVFLDTAIRFSDAESENSSSENAKGLANDIFALLRAGSPAVIGLHHSPKDSSGHSMTLENVLRGTGDLGAMCDAVYGLQTKDADETRLLVKCVKPRDFEPVKPFEIQGRPYIDEAGDFALLETGSDENGGQATRDEELERLAQLRTANPKAGLRKMGELLGCGKDRAKKLLEEVERREAAKQSEPLVAV